VSKLIHITVYDHLPDMLICSVCCQNSADPSRQGHVFRHNDIGSRSFKSFRLWGGAAIFELVGPSHPKDV